MNKIITVAFSILISVSGISPVVSEDGSATWRETDWSKYLASNLTDTNRDHFAIAEYVLPDSSRIDIYEEQKDKFICWEVEWASKWEESIGQSMFYYLSCRNRTGKPHAMGIWLLKKPGEDEDYLRCLMCVNELHSKGFPVYLRVQKVNK